MKFPLIRVQVAQILNGEAPDDFRPGTYATIAENALLLGAAHWGFTQSDLAKFLEAHDFCTDPYQVRGTLEALVDMGALVIERSGAIFYKLV